MKTILIILSVVCFLLATVIALGSGTFVWAQALVPAGLMFFVGSFLVKE